MRFGTLHKFETKYLCNFPGDTMFFERFAALCDGDSISPNALASEIGVSSGTITNWKNGRKPKIEHLQLISHRFGVSIDYLVGESSIKNAENELRAILRLDAEQPLNDRDLRILNLVRQIPDEKVDAYLRLMLQDVPPSE